MKDIIFNRFNELARQTSFEARGLVLNNNSIVTLGSDSKLIGRIFELITHGLLVQICNENHWVLEETESQTVYPDFTIHGNNSRIAIDVKSTYRRYNNNNELLRFGFTLGSFASFLRDNTKNIQYPYDTYTNHFVIGFVYDRVTLANAGQIKTLTDEIQVPYNNVEFFIQEKHKISGDKPGSGNTENIGSFLSNDIRDFINGNGPFASLGITVFEDYWKNYPKYRASSRLYTNLNEYFTFRNINV